MSQRRSNSAPPSLMHAQHQQQEPWIHATLQEPPWEVHASCPSVVLPPPALEGSLAPDANDNKDAKKETPDEDADIESDSASSDTSDTLSGNPGSTIGESVGAESDSDIKDSLRFNYEIMRGTSRPMTEDLVKTRQY